MDRGYEAPLCDRCEVELEPETEVIRGTHPADPDTREANVSGEEVTILVHAECWPAEARVWHIEYRGLLQGIWPPPH
jgi:hypothetical protein